MQVLKNAEIKQYINSSYISAAEAAWRIFRSPTNPQCCSATSTPPGMSPRHIRSGWAPRTDTCPRCSREDHADRVFQGKCKSGDCANCQTADIPRIPSTVCL